MRKNLRKLCHFSIMCNHRNGYGIRNNPLPDQDASALPPLIYTLLAEKSQLISPTFLLSLFFLSLILSHIFFPPGNWKITSSDISFSGLGEVTLAPFFLPCFIFLLLFFLLPPPPPWFRHWPDHRLCAMCSSEAYATSRDVTDHFSLTLTNQKVSFFFSPGSAGGQ